MNLKTILTNSLFKSVRALPSELEEQLGYLDKVESWRDIYEGGGSWRYVRKGGLEDGYRRVRSISAAQALCSELAALCFSQQMDISYKDTETRRLVADVLQKNSFWSCFPLFLERLFALGGGVIKVYGDNGDICLDYVDANGFLPTQYDEKGVYGGIAFSRSKKDGTSYLLMESHRKTDTGYTVTNRLMKKTPHSGQYKETDLAELYPGLEEETVINGLKKPLFVYFRPACAGGNAFFEGGALGASVFAAAVDTLESLDVVFDSLQREFILGRKRIIVPTSALRGEYGSDGKLHKYFDEHDEVFQAFSADDKEELKIYDNSGTLRVTEHTEALEQLLDLLCMQVGLSEGSLSYHSSAAKTATEVVALNDKTYRTKTAHQQLIRESLIQVMNNIVLLAVLQGQLRPPALEDEPVITFADSVSNDNSTKIDNALRLLDAGVIDKNKALAEVYGLTEEEAADN